MGQYREWLRYREFNIKLHAQLRLLEEDIVQLQQQIGMYAQYAFPEENAVLLALAASLDAQTQGLSLPLAPLDTSSPTTIPTTEQTQATISPALHAWSELPFFETVTTTDTGVNLTETARPSLSHTQQEPVPTTPHEEITLLPQDMSAFFEEHTMTEPQIELPWWLRTLIESSLSSQGTRPIDQESLRTNRLVQRWSERWGRVTPSQQQQAHVNYQSIPPSQEEQQ